MAIGDIVPWKWGGLRRLQEDRGFDSFRNEMETLHRSLDRLFESAWGGASFGPSLLSEAWTKSDVVPRLDFAEDDKAFRVTVELPGMNEKDIAVTVADRVLTIRGEKKEEKEQKDNEVYRRERAFGSFRRAIELPGNVDSAKIDASFRNGVLTIQLPKSKDEQEKVKQIPVKAA